MKYQKILDFLQERIAYLDAIYRIFLQHKGADCKYTQEFIEMRDLYTRMSPVRSNLRFASSKDDTEILHKKIELWRNAITHRIRKCLISYRKLKELLNAPTPGVDKQVFDLIITLNTIVSLDRERRKINLSAMKNSLINHQSSISVNRQAIAPTKSISTLCDSFIDIIKDKEIEAQYLALSKKISNNVATIEERDLSNFLYFIKNDPFEESYNFEDLILIMRDEEELGMGPIVINCVANVYIDNSVISFDFTRFVKCLNETGLMDRSLQSEKLKVFAKFSNHIQDILQKQYDSEKDKSRERLNGYLVQFKKACKEVLNVWGVFNDAYDKYNGEYTEFGSTTAVYELALKLESEFNNYKKNIDIINALNNNVRSIIEFLKTPTPLPQSPKPDPVRLSPISQATQSSGSSSPLSQTASVRDTTVSPISFLGSPKLSSTILPASPFNLKSKDASLILELLNKTSKVDFNSIIQLLTKYGGEVRTPRGGGSHRSMWLSGKRYPYYTPHPVTEMPITLRGFLIDMVKGVGLAQAAQEWGKSSTIQETQAFKLLNS